MPHWSKDAEYLRQKDEWANVRKGMAAKRYNSYGNRYLRSCGLSVRLGGDGGGVLCSGDSCVADTQYGSGSAIKLLEYQFPGKPPVQVATTQDWIRFSISQEVVYGTVVGATYGVRISASWQVLLAQGSECNQYSHFDSDSYSLYGPIDISDPYLFKQDEYSCGTALTYAYSLTHRGIRGFTFGCRFGGAFSSTPITQVILWDYINTIGYTIEGTLAQSVEWIRCQDGLPPDPLGLKITVSDPTGVIHVGRGVPGFLTLPSVSIVEGSPTAGFVVQSAKYPQVFYSVPANYSSCECGDFNQQVIKPDYAARSWVGTNAGGFNPCKHIMAVKRVLGIPQSFTDYVPYVKQYREDVPKPRYEQDNGRLDGYR